MKTSSSNTSDVSPDAWFHRLWIGLAVAILSASFLLRFDDHRGIRLPGIETAFPNLCSSRRLFGIDCPGCGLTRSFLAISRGQFAMAWDLNRTSFAVYAFVVGQIPWHGFQLIRLHRKQKPWCWPPIYSVPIGLALVMTGNWMLQMVGI